MRELKLPGINRVRKSLAKEGRYEDYYYAWKGKDAPRLPGNYGSQEFIAAYCAAVASRRVTKTGPVAHQTATSEETLGWLINEKFLQSQHYKRLDPKNSLPIRLDYSVDLGKIQRFAAGSPQG